MRGCLEEVKRESYKDQYPYKSTNGVPVNGLIFTLTKTLLKIHTYLINLRLNTFKLEMDVGVSVLMMVKNPNNKIEVNMKPLVTNSLNIENYWKQLSTRLSIKQIINEQGGDTPLYANKGK